MTTYVALLRAINVGGSGKLAMADLVALCISLGFHRPRTYVQSGNVIFQASASESDVQSALQAALHDHMGKPVDVLVRTAAELQSILDANPFQAHEPNKVHIVFLNSAPAIEAFTAPAGEQLAPGSRELYICYPQGQGQSKLKLPTGKAAATARNVNTVAKLAAMAQP